MTKRNAIRGLTDLFDAILSAGNGDSLIALSSAGGGELLFCLCVVGGGGDPDRPCVFLFRRAEGMELDDRRRAVTAFGRIGRRLQPVGFRGRLQWFVNLEGDAGIAAEAAVGFLDDIYGPSGEDYGLQVRRRRRHVPTCVMPDVGRPVREPSA